MKFEITLDEKLLQDLFEGTFGDPEKLNRIQRMQYHVLIWSKELLAIWRMLEHSDLLRNNPTVRLHFQNWITMLPQKPSSFRRVKANVTEVQGDPTEVQRVVLGTAYQSDDKIVVGDYPEPLRASNSSLTFVSRESFSRAKTPMITWEQIRIVLSSADNAVEDLFDIFETPIVLEVPQDSDSELLASYLAHFFDEQLVIQDDYFVRNIENESNFTKYVLPKVHPNCRITLRVGIDDSTRERGSAKKSSYEGMTPHKISVACIDRRGENLHDGYFETSRFRITIPYRLGVFGRRGKTRRCTIHINRKRSP